MVLETKSSGVTSPNAALTQWPRARVLAGVLYGFLGGATYAVLTTTIDALTIRDLPLTVDGGRMLSLMVFAGGGFALLGAITAWSCERGRGVIIGALVLALVAFGGTLLTASSAVVTNLVLTFFALGPVAAVCFPLVFVLRWLADKHEAALKESGVARASAIAVCLTVALALGAVPGAAARLPEKGHATVNFVHQLAQNSQTESALTALPGFAAHAGQTYSLTARPSRISTEGYDVTVIYPDGYRITCTAVGYTGQRTFLRGCAEGSEPPR